MSEDAIKVLNRAGHAVWLAMNGQDDPPYDELTGFVAASSISGMLYSAKAVLGALSSDRLNAQIIQDLEQTPGIGLKQLLRQQLCALARKSADALLPVYEQTAGRFGHVAIPAPPDCLHPESASWKAMQNLQEAVSRPNVMFTLEISETVFPTIRWLARQGIPFIVKRAYTFHDIDQVLVAYMSGLTDRVRDGKSLLSCHCGIMMNLNELDRAVDDLLPVYSDYKSLTAIALGKRCYIRMLRSTGSRIFHDLVQDYGALNPRMIFRSSPEINAPEMQYVQPLIGRDVVSCVRQNTLADVRNMENHEITIMEDLLEAEDMLDHLQVMQIDLPAMAHRIKQQTMQSYYNRFDLIMSELDKRRSRFLAA